jgi:hypothetical protein
MIYNGDTICVLCFLLKILFIVEGKEMGMGAIQPPSVQRNKHTVANPLELYFSIQPEEGVLPELSRPLNKGMAILPILVELIEVVDIHY